MIAQVQLLFALAWRNLWRRPRRTLITLLVVAVGLYSILCFAAILEAWARSSRDTALNLLIGSGQIHVQGYLDDPTVNRRMPPPHAKLRAALAVPAISAWVERVRVPAVIQSEYKILPLTLLGIDPHREARISTLSRQIAAGRSLADGADTGILLGRHFASRLKTRLGRRVIVMAQAADGTLAQRSYQVIGLFGGTRAAEDQYAFAGLEIAQQMLGIGDSLSEIGFQVPDDRQLGQVIARLQAAAPDLDVRSWEQLSPMAAAMDAFMHAFVYIWLWIMFVLMAIGIVNTQLMAVFERVHELGLLQALGMRPRLILAQVLVESTLLIGLGVLIGMAASALTIFAFHGGIDLGFLARGAEFFGAGHILYPRLAPQQFLALSALVWALGVLVALWPAGKAARTSSLKAMSHVT